MTAKNMPTEAALLFTLLGILIGGLVVTMVHGRFTTSSPAPAQAAVIEVVIPTVTEIPWYEVTPSVTPTRTPRPTVVPDNQWPNSVSVYVGGSIDQARVSPTPTKEPMNYCSHYDRLNDSANAGKPCKKDPWDEPTPTPRACETAKSNQICYWQPQEKKDDMGTVEATQEASETPHAT